METSGGGGGDPFATPGFRFYPTEEELLSFYLRHRLAGTNSHIDRAIPVVDVYGHHPSELRSMAGEASVRDAEQWFFFCARAEREMHGGRPARTTPSGYWKATGSPSWVFSSSATAATEVIGVKRTMVFYQGRAPAGTKTRWKMNEYKAVDADDAAAAVHQPTAPLRLRNEFSVCRVYISTGTLRSFDRRPLDPPGQYQSLYQYAPSRPPANTNLAEDDGAIASTGQADKFHDWSSLITAAAVDDFSFDIDFSSSTAGEWRQML